jgi:uncharacterized membrane protein YtjA (UPF0391 family)
LSLFPYKRAINYDFSKNTRIIPDAKCNSVFLNGTVFSKLLIRTLFEIIFYNLKFKLMLRWTVIFLVVAIIAAIFGFGGIASGAASIAKVLFFIFIVLFLLSLIFGRSATRSGDL